jgi:hypothetical protein
MHIERQTAHEIAIDVITSFRDVSPTERPAALAQLSRAADTSPTANSRRGRALIAFWQEAARAVALDTEHQDRTYTGTVEAHGNARDAAFVAAGNALYSVVVQIVPVTAAALLAGQPVEV